MNKNNAELSPRFNIPIRESDGYVNATELCRASGKLFGHYRSNNQTELFLEELSSEVGIPISQLIESNKGNTSKFEQGTWVHPDVAVHLATWASPKFAVFVSRLVNEWRAGKFQPTVKEIDPTSPETVLTLANHVIRLIGENKQLKEQNEGLNEKVDNLKEEVRITRPMVYFANRVSESVNCQTVGKVAKELNIGRNELFKRLRDAGILDRSNTPYQRFIDSGYFKVVLKTYNRNGTERQYSRTWVTGKGVVWLHKRFFTVEELQLPLKLNNNTPILHQIWTENQKKSEN